jgi:NAD(P)-dependent dehydrogenase (short-subunit alcohol dehydrogenase family)
LRSRRLQDPCQFRASHVRRDADRARRHCARERPRNRRGAGLARAAPTGRLGKAEEVANTILFLASDESSATTGGEFMVDGRLTAQ